MRVVGLTVNPGEVQVASSRVKLHALVVDHGTVPPSEGMHNAILEYPPPHINKKALRPFWGILVLHYQYCNKHPQLSHLFNPLLRPGMR